MPSAISATPWGLPRHALPAPIASGPRRQPPAGAKDGLVRAPTVAPEDMIEAEAGVYDGLCAVNIHRALSLVPAEVTGFFDPDTVHCLPDAVLRDFGTEYRSLTWLGCSRRAAWRAANGCREVLQSRHDTGGTNAQRWLRLLRHVLVQSFS